MAEVTPQTARRAFKQRQIVFGFVVPLGISATVLGVSIAYYGRATPPWTWLVFLVGASLLYVLLSRFQRKVYHALTRVDLFCPHCDKHAACDSPWICGYCDRTNEDWVTNPFVGRCQHCRRGAQSYVCSHCEQTVLLGTALDGRHPARIPIANREQVQPIDPFAEKKKEHQLRKAEIEHEIEITQLNARLEQLKKSSEFKEERSVQEKLQRQFSDFQANTMGVQMIERAERASIESECKDDPDAREKRLLCLRAFVESHGLTWHEPDKKRVIAE